MNVLGFDTSTAATAVCLLRRDGRAFEAVPAPSDLGAPPAHARELLPAIARVLDEGATDWSDLDAIAVGEGPGTFTGLRIGIATARGLAQARGLPVHPVSSLAALAAGIEAELRLPLIDAKRGEVFAALYENGQARWEPFVASPEALVERLRSLPERISAPLAAGDGSVRFRGVLETVGVEVAPDGSALHVVRALHVCRLAAGAPPRPSEAVVPVYLRTPDAKPAR